MTTVTNRTMPRESLRQRIYEAAIGEFRDKGYEASTVEAIARRAGVAKGTLFNFYAGKLDVLLAYYAELDAEVAPLRRKLDIKAPERSLISYARAVERVFLREGDLILALVRQIASGGRLRDADEESGSNDEEDIRRFFVLCHERGTLRTDPATAAAIVIDLWAGAVRRWAAGAPLAATFEAKLKAAFKGLGERK